jgi:hypothetical protein
VDTNTNNTDQILELQNLSRNQLLDRWHKLYGKTPPPGIRREVIIPFLAYRIQENTEGGLSPAVRAMLKSAIRQLQRTHNSERRIRYSRMRSGTRVCRRWKDEMHEVDITETAYQYRGHEYRSLSEIARKITGTRWSGPAFFGLKKLLSQRDQNGD